MIGIDQDKIIPHVIYSDLLPLKDNDFSFMIVV